MQPQWNCEHTLARRGGRASAAIPSPPCVWVCPAVTPHGNAAHARGGRHARARVPSPPSLSSRACRRVRLVCLPVLHVPLQLYSTTFGTQSHRRPIHTPHRQLVAPTIWKQKFGRKGGVWRPELGARCIGLRDAQGQ